MHKDYRPWREGIGLRCGAAPGLALLLALSPWQAHAAGVVRDSLGPISSGRGGTNIAYTDNLSLINDNPAGLAAIQGLRLEFGVDLLKAEVEYREEGHTSENKNEIFLLPNAAVSWQVRGAPRPVVVALGLFMPSGYGAEYRLQHPLYGRQDYNSRVGLFKLMPTVAIDVGWGLSVGAGVGVAYERAEFALPYTFQEPTGMLPALGNPPVLIDVDTDGFGIAWNVGIQYQIIKDRWTVGVAYIAETRIELEGDFDVEAPGGASSSYDIEVENTWPRSLGVGTAYRFDRGTVSAEFLWFDWSSAFDAFTFHLKNGSNPAFDALLGTTTPSDRFPLEWHDGYTVRVGGEFFVTPRDTIRAGYIYMTNPVPDRTLTPIIPGILEHSFSVGYGRQLHPRAGLDLAYQFSLGRTRTVHQSEIVGGDFDESSINAMAHWLMVGVNLTF